MTAKKADHKDEKHHEKAPKDGPERTPEEIEAEAAAARHHSEHG